MGDIMTWSGTSQDHNASVANEVLDDAWSESPVTVVDGGGLTAMGAAAAAQGFLWIQLEPPGPQYRGRLGLYIEETIEAHLEERGALAPGIQASTGLDASLSDQLYRARLIEMRGIALGIPHLEGIANLGRTLDAEDSAVLRWWMIATADRPVRMVLSRENMSLRVYPSPVLFDTLFEVAPGPPTPRPADVATAESVEAMELSDLPPRVASVRDQSSAESGEGVQPQEALAEEGPSEERSEPGPADESLPSTRADEPPPLAQDAMKSVLSEDTSAGDDVAATAMAQPGQAAVADARLPEAPRAESNVSQRTDHDLPELAPGGEPDFEDYIRASTVAETPETPRTRVELPDLDVALGLAPAPSFGSIHVPEPETAETSEVEAQVPAEPVEHGRSEKACLVGRETNAEHAPADSDGSAYVKSAASDEGALGARFREESEVDAALDAEETSNELTTDEQPLTERREQPTLPPDRGELEPINSADFLRALKEDSKRRPIIRAWGDDADEKSAAAEPLSPSGMADVGVTPGHTHVEGAPTPKADAEEVEDQGSQIEGSKPEQEVVLAQPADRRTGATPLPTKAIARKPFIRSAEQKAEVTTHEAEQEDRSVGPERTRVEQVTANHEVGHPEKRLVSDETPPELDAVEERDPEDPFNQLAEKEWKQWLVNLEAARGPRPLAAIERMFVTDYTRLREAVRRGIAGDEAHAALDEWQASFALSYSEAFDALRVRGKRPTMVLDLPELAQRIGRLQGARRVQLMLVDGMRFDLGLMVQDRMKTRVDAALTERLLLWSALPTTTTYQLELLGKGPDGLKEQAASEDSPALVARGNAARNPRRIRTGRLEILKLDLVEAALAEPGPPVMNRLSKIAGDVADALSSHISQLPPRTLVMVFGDHGFALDPKATGTTEEVVQGGATPEEVLVPAFAWLTGAVH